MVVTITAADGSTFQGSSFTAVIRARFGDRVQVLPALSEGDYCRIAITDEEGLPESIIDVREVSAKP